jgi:hypothetical protein
MFLWGIDGQIWAVLWAVSDYTQLREVDPTRTNLRGS